MKRGQKEVTSHLEWAATLYIPAQACVRLALLRIENEACCRHKNRKSTSLGGVQEDLIEQTLSKVVRVHHIPYSTQEELV